MVPNIDFSNPSFLATFLSSLAPVLLGGITTYFKFFLKSIDDFHSDIKLKRISLKEKLATKHATLLNHARKIESNNLLRGDNVNEPDLVSDYTDEMFRLFNIFYKLNLFKQRISISYYILFVTIALGVMGLIFSWLSNSIRVYVFWYGILAPFIQIITILVVHATSQTLKHYEDII